MGIEEAIHYLQMMLKSKHKETYVYADEAIKVLLRNTKTEASYKKIMINTLEKNQTEYNELAGEIHRLEAELKEAKDNEYSANCIISDLLDEMKKKEKIIDGMAEELLTKRAWAFKCGGKEEQKELKNKIIEEYEEKVENGD